MLGYGYMMIRTSTEVYYEEAEELLTKGDLVQACEKYYKAVEEAIKLLAFEYGLHDVIREAEENGWDSKTLNDAVSELSKRLGDKIIDAWSSAVTLYTARKFLDKDLVELYRDSVKAIVEEAKRRSEGGS